MTPEELPAEAPIVSYAGGQLKIDSKNATLAEIFDAIQKKTGTEFESLPEVAKERVAIHLAGSPREVLSDLLYGSKFGYVILTNPSDPNAVQKVVLADPEPDKQGKAPAVASTDRPQIPVRWRPPVPARAGENSADAEEPAASADSAPAPMQSSAESETTAQPATAPAESVADRSNTSEPAPPSPPTAFTPNQANSDQGQPQPKTAEEFMQNLYRQRLQIQEQQQQQKTPPPQ